MTLLTRSVNQLLQQITQYSNSSVLVHSGRHTGTAHNHRLVRRHVAEPVLLLGQDQDRLVDRERIQVPSAMVSREGTGALAAGALGLPDDGRDSVLHHGPPEHTTSGSAEGKCQDVGSSSVWRNGSPVCVYLILVLWNILDHVQFHPIHVRPQVEKSTQNSTNPNS